MKESVRAAFVGFTAPLEGVCNWLYLDTRGLVTTGVGNLVDPIELALPLPWQNTDDSPATQDEITDAWLAVKARQDMRSWGGGHFAKLTTIRLSDGGVLQLVGRKLSENDSYLRARFLEYEDWPADAQLAVLSMAWALGADFQYPKFQTFVKAQDFDGAASECTIHDEHGGEGGTLKQRNIANRILLHNAARVLSMGLDPDRLWYPRELIDEPPTDTGTRILNPPIDFPPRSSKPPDKC